ncbi:transcriptional regulator [Bacillus sp. AFS001701]|uniref:transcriptional regulator n=1 Tax=Bacillaceae TaxID=186817 RepID=UPI000BF6EE34|nr:transcriptional regulator [Bacillus sp. AFS001701]PET75588.1 transcriptional regulator [Bacillus sp. AFS001701]
MKKIRLGLLGSDDSIDVIQSVIKEYPEFECTPIIYWREEEIPDLLSPVANDFDIWLFSGKVPYAIAKSWGGITRPMFFTPHTGPSLYKTLLQIFYHNQIAMEQISFDNFHYDELNSILDEAEIKANHLFLKYYEGEEVDAKVLAGYHYELWKSGKTKAAVTCLRSAHIELEKMGVPVYRVLPAKSAIESVLNLALRTYEMLHFKESQIAVQMIEIDSYFGLAKDTFSTDEIYKIEIKMAEKLLVYANKVQGSLKSAGPGRYVIFTTRGLLQDITNEFSIIPNLEDLEELKKEVITCGIGIGKTAYEAEIHAGRALFHAREYGKGSWMVALDNRTIVGPLGREEQITYSYVSKELQKISEQTSLSISTLSKLESILKKLGKSEIGAHELAQYMQIMPRSARRILKELEEQGIAQVIGEETPYSRGRPRNIYKISL